MSKINVQKFVDIDITSSATALASGSRSTCVLLISSALVSAGTIEENGRYITSLTDLSDITFVGNEVAAFISTYFTNGGKRLHVYSYSHPLEGTILSSLPDEEIIVSGIYDASVFTAAHMLAELAAYNALVHGIKCKKLVIRERPAREATATLSADLAVSVNVGTKDVMSKYSTTFGTEASISAYLSKIDINRANVVQDYDFTVEVVTPEESDDALLDTCMDEHMNVDMFLAGQIRNIGGNTKDGKDLVNEFMLIVLQQTATEALLNVLASKLKGSAGVSAIATALAQELGRYVSNGYLATDKIWTKDDYVVSYNNVNYTVIEKNTPLLAGYQIRVLPYVALTDADKAAHKAPPIYIILATNYGIRLVTGLGETF